MKNIHSAIKTLNKLGLWVAITSLTLLVFIALGEMLARSFWGVSLGFASEFSGYLVAFSFFSGSGWALSQGGHIRVDLLSDKLSPKFTKLFEIVATAFGVVICMALTYGLIKWAMGTYERGSVSYYQSETPLWIPQLIFSFGPLFLTLALFAHFLDLLSNKEDQK